MISELTTTGLVGFVVYMLLWVRMIWVVIRRMRAEEKEDIWTLMLGAALVGYFVQNLFLFDTHATLLQAALLIGWVASSESGFLADPTEPDSGDLPSKGSVHPSSGEDDEQETGAAKKFANAWPERWISQVSKWVNRGAGHITAGPWIGATIVMLLLMASLYFLVYRPYRAAQLFPVPPISWEELWEEVGLSIEAFPPMGTQPRLMLFDTLVTEWDVITQVGVEEIMERLQPVETAALKAEPRNPDLYLTLGALYQKAAATDPRYLESARQHLETAQRMAPEYMETVLLTISQQVLEKDYQGALAAIERNDTGPPYPFSRELALELAKLREKVEQILNSGGE